MRAEDDMFDEMRGSGDAVRPAYAELSQWLGSVKPDVLDFRRREAELFFRRIGITFAVYGHQEGAGAPHPLRHHSAHYLARRMDPASAA